MKKSLGNLYKNLNKQIISCKKCKRLVQFRNKISSQKRKKYLNETYWNKPITGFGDLKAKILIIGLAPAAHGGTRTGRVFTGDKSSDFLYKCLYSAKISNQPTTPFSSRKKQGSVTRRGDRGGWCHRQGCGN